MLLFNSTTFPKVLHKNVEVCHIQVNQSDIHTRERVLRNGVLLSNDFLEFYNLYDITNQCYRSSKWPISMSRRCVEASSFSSNQTDRSV